MRVLVTGASSLPGYRTCLKFLEESLEVIGVYFMHDIPIQHKLFKKVKSDIRDFTKLLKIFKKYEPKVVIHMAAYGDVDGCERDKHLAWNVNVKGTTNIVKLSNKFSDYLLYLSTDYVFDGLRGMYRELDLPDPINYYGLTKLCGEVITLSSSIDNSIVRASSIYGLGPGRKNFSKFLIEKLSSNQKVKALTDQYTSPTQASLLAEAISEIVGKRLTGIFHVVGERMSRYEFALKIADTFDFDRNLIEKASMENFKWFARRPKDSSLNCEYTRRSLNTDFYSSNRTFNKLKEELKR